MTLKETETIELKKSTSELKEAVISIVSVLNKHQQGDLYFGVMDNGRVIGQSITQKTLRDISKSISDNIEPKVFPKISEVVLEGRKCIHVRFSGSDVPYYAYGRAYIRVVDEDKKLSAKELENLVLEKNRGKLHWDGEICRDARISDISPVKLKNFLKKAGLEYHSIKSSLAKLGLLKEGMLLNSAVVLFGKNPEKFFPNAKLRCAVFATDDASVILDRQELYGDILFLVERAEQYILKNIYMGMRVEGLSRKDVPEIDREAFREAIVNAFCHRDYYSYDAVHVAIFKDRLEIRNPGLLYGSLTIEKIMAENVSERRNEIIAEMFHKVHLVEKWGRGISLILSKEPTADFKEIGRQFVTVFKRKTTPKTTPLTTPYTTLKTHEKILSLIEENPNITKENLAKELNITVNGVKYHIRRLRKSGKIIKKGRQFVTVFKRKTTPKTTPFTTPYTTLKTHEKILSLIEENPSITKENLAKELNITVNGVKYHIKKLRKSGKIIKKGRRKVVR